MKTTPLKGMKDILPREQRIRDYVQGEILKTCLLYTSRCV